MDYRHFPEDDDVKAWRLRPSKLQRLWGFVRDHYLIEISFIAGLGLVFLGFLLK